MLLCYYILVGGRGGTADAADSKSAIGDYVGVQIPSSAPYFYYTLKISNIFIFDYKFQIEFRI